MAGEKGGSGTTIVYGSQDEKPKSIIDAIAELEQYSAVLGDEEIPEQFFTFKQKLEFFSVGFRDALVSGIVSALFTPLTFGVIEKLIPIFGNTSPTFFDKVFAFCLTLGFSLGYAVLIAVVLAKHYYSNKIVKSAAQNFLTGLYMGKILAVFVVFIAFHFLYFFITPERVAYVLNKFLENSAVKVKAYVWILQFKEVFIASAYFVAFTGVLFIIIPTFAILYYRFKVRRHFKNIEDL